MRTDKSAAGHEQGPVPEDLCATGQLYRWISQVITLAPAIAASSGSGDDQFFLRDNSLLGFVLAKQACLSHSSRLMSR